MDKKKILMVSRAFYPMQSPRALRTTELVKEFARRGHEVTLLTARNNAYHDQFEERHGIIIKDLGKLRFPEVILNGSSGVVSIFKRGLRRGLLMLFEYPNIELMFKVNKALQKESGYDLLISVAVPYPVHWGVAMARRDDHPIANIWAADCGDPYCGLENDSFNKLFYFAYIEKWCFRKADYITIPFEGAKRAYFKEFHPKIRVIPQGLSFPPKKDVSEPSTNDHITFAYFGNIQSYLHYAIPFLKKLNSIYKPFTFMVYTKNKQLFENTLNSETLSKCEIRDYVERDRLFEELSGIDFLIHFPYQKATQKSLKLVDYAYLGKPVLSYKNDEKSNSVLKEFLNYNFEKQMQLDDYSTYKIENVADQFLQLVQTEQQSMAS